MRAVRAVAGIQSASAKVNAELNARYHVTLCSRTGIKTGEVVASVDANAGQGLATSIEPTCL